MPIWIHNVELISSVNNTANFNKFSDFFNLNSIKIESIFCFKIENERTEAKLED